MIIMKIGGSSIFDAASLKNVVDIIKKRLPLQPALVASAMGKTTRKLLNAGKTATGNFNNALDILDEIQKFHFDIFSAFHTEEKTYNCRERLLGYFTEIKQLLEMVAGRGELSPFLQDKILSFGELISTNIISAALKHSGINTKLLDARICLITDDHFTHAHPIEEKCYPKIKEYITPVLDEGCLPVIQGYIGSTASGETTTLGFEGSDYSAVLIGAALQASDIQIWKDVSGVLTADPAVIAEPYTVKSMSYAEAAELSLCGAKVLHPNTIQPAQKFKIPVSIYNSKQPEAQGTIIGKDSIAGDSAVKSITYRKSLCIFNVCSNESISEFDFLSNTFALLKKDELVPHIILGCGKKISLALDYSEKLRSLIDSFSPFSSVDIQNNKATISIVGENICSDKHLLIKAQAAAGKENIELTASNISSHSFSFVVNEAKVQQIISRLHEFFFQDINPNIFARGNNER